MHELISEIKKCTICADNLSEGSRPVMAAHPLSKIIIIGQAPGAIVHKTGVPWNDKSGVNLRNWLGIDKSIFYDSKKIAILPMGFCYPGRGGSGDLPPRPECAPQWHDQVLGQLKEVELTLLIGQYAQKYYLRDRMRKTLTETVRNYEEYLPEYFVLPHPSPRNNIWRAKHSWFDQEVVPELRKKIANLLK